MAAANPPPEQSAADTAVDPDQKLLEDPPATDATPPREEMDVAAAVGRLEAVVSERLSYDAEKEEAFSRLYKDLEHFRGEALGQRLRPVLLDLILLVDRLDAALSADAPVRDPLAFMASFREELGEVLERQGVTALARAETAFDPQMQRAVQVEPAADAGEHNSVARVLRRGYLSDGKILRPEDVVVRRFAAPPAADGAP